MRIQTMCGMVGRALGGAVLAVSVAGVMVLGAEPARAGMAAAPRALASAVGDTAGPVEKIGYRHDRRRGFFTSRRHHRHHRHHRGYYRRTGPHIGVYIGVPYASYAYPFGYYYAREYVPRYRPYRVRHHYGRPRPWTPAWYDYCRAKYRSFNPRTGYYLAYSGRYRMCR
ncbi:BA14K family protein [Breoghania sp. L-A4]|uniref:BA14K family protein n=1 Tax=Breoghania sp. L-A4 TaxID=2304600 RepID=UPI0020BDE026|nr:BA14K family protein [Breoghania sp. L-A4]